MTHHFCKDQNPLRTQPSAVFRCPVGALGLSFRGNSVYLFPNLIALDIRHLQNQLWAAQGGCRTQSAGRLEKLFRSWPEIICRSCLVRHWMSFVLVEHRGCHRCSAAFRVRPESLCAKKKVSGEPAEKNLRFEALLQGNFAAERLEFPLAAEKEREGHILTFWVEDCFWILDWALSKMGTLQNLRTGHWSVSAEQD